MNAPPKPNRNAVRRAALALARDIRIRVRIIELRRLAEQTAGGELPELDDDPLNAVMDNDKSRKKRSFGNYTRG
jgi:hypothetical protein